MLDLRSHFLRDWDGFRSDCEVTKTGTINNGIAYSCGKREFGVRDVVDM